MITRAPDPRPFLVDTPHGVIRALGTRSDIRCDGHGSTVSVVTRQKMDGQNLNTIDAVLANTTGIIMYDSPMGGRYVYSRGFMVETYQFDGVTAPGTTRRRTALPAIRPMLDHVEIVPAWPCCSKRTSRCSPITGWPNRATPGSANTATGALQKWSVGGGVNFQTENSRVTQNITVTQGA
ncbi:TonB-dependent receptor plug domain-containing protein [Janthinobacterium sp. RB2P8]|uniref:TonB-dependent receptor plug domain-containing protein n=1 Tax=Janthinobacterium sp. RB2P8 TaxID=3424191 RepID=UPI003F2686BD